MSPVWRRKSDAQGPRSLDGPTDLSVWLDVHAAAEYADVPLVQLSRAIHSKKLSVRTEPTTGIWRINITDLEAWCLDELGRPPRGKPRR